MARVVLTNRMPAEAVRLLEDAGHEVDPWAGEEAPAREEVLGRIAGADAVVTMVTDRVDDAFLDAAGGQLRVVANVAVGYDNIDVPACTARGVVATNTPGVLVEATADTAFALVLMATRRLGEGERLIRSGQPWKWGMDFLLGMGLQGKVFGLVGPGAIGIATARRARVFGMEIVYQGRSPMEPGAEAELGARRVDLPELLATADVVSLLCPLVPAGQPDPTHHLIDAHALAAMKDSAYLVNSARGPIVDEAALVEALRDGVIAGAGLDVFEDEPRVHPGLLELENVVLLPHLGSATVETRTAMATLAVRNVLGVLGGDGPLNPLGG